MRVFALVLAGGLALGCVRSREPAAEPGARWETRDWMAALTAAQEAALAGRYEDADRELELYAFRNPGSVQAREAWYWRAVFNLDPANPRSDARAATTQLERYLADSLVFTQHRSEALMLRRLATTIDSLSRASGELAMATQRTAEGVAANARERETELVKQNQQLKEQLERTTAELERIKRRVAGQP